MRHEVVEVIAVIVTFLSFYGLITSKSMIKATAFLVIMEASVIMFFLSLGNRKVMLPPIYSHGHLENMEIVADPLPQALMITAIVIGLSVTAVNVIMLITVFRKYGTTDWDTVKNKNMEEGSV